MKKTLSALTAVLMCANMFPLNAFAADEINSGYTGSKNLTEEEKAAFYTEKALYSDYYDEHISESPGGTAELKFDSASDDADCEIKDYEGEKNAVVWNSQVGELNYTCNVPADGNYSIKIKYYPIPGNMFTSEFSVLIDGESPYDAATRIELPHTWASANEIAQNSRGHEQRPVQVEIPQWITMGLSDPDGIFNTPLIFNMSKGDHTITFKSEKAAIAIASIELYSYEAPPAYEAPSGSDLSMAAGAPTIKVQGENYKYTTSNEILPDRDRGDYRTEDHNGDPCHPIKDRYNLVGGSWHTPGQSATWEIEVPQDGWYHLGIKARQSSMRGMFSNRRIYIDGVVPNTALDDVRFNYNSDWVMTTPQDENGNEAYVYLTAGTHELTLEAIPGEIGNIMRRLNKIVQEVNNYYLRILMITGPTPDKYTDYFVQNEIPDLVSSFKEYAIELRDIQNEIETLSNQKGSEAAALDRLATVLNYCVKKPNKIPNQIASIKDNISSISSWVLTYRQQPLEIDYIEISPASSKMNSIKKSFAKSASFGMKSFFGSFFEDYTVLSDTSASSVNIWVGLGRDQANVVKQMVDSDFNGQYGVDAAINIVQGGLMEAVLAGKGPDVSLFTGGEFPVNLAIRDLLVPLNDMNGFDEVYSRMGATAFIPYSHENVAYGVPLTRNFPMMYYRKDILSSIGIYEYPETWDNLIDMLPAFQRKYLQPGLILPVSPLPATEEGHTFALLMLQSGLNYYNDENSATNFNSQEAVEAFDTWTKFYTTYGFDQAYDAFTRFRQGEAPIVIQDYCVFYNQLNLAAPEIKGLWDFAPVPGTLREDGTIDHTANSSGSGVIILKDCKDKEGAWTFIKWFSETEQMTNYARMVEGVMGPLGRIAPADREALKQLNWSKSDLEKILMQMDELDEIPIIPSSYVVTRGVMNAFRAVVNDHDNARETLRWYNKDIDAEITRKRKSLGIE